MPPDATPQNIADPADAARVLHDFRNRIGPGKEFSIICTHPWLSGLAPAADVAPGQRLALACRPRLLRQVIRQLGLTLSAERRLGRFATQFDIAGGSPPAPSVIVVTRCEVADRTCRLDGRIHAIRRGNWAFYVPDLGLKILHASQGRRWCFHTSRPHDALLEDGDGTERLGPYTLAEWRDALATSVLRRAAENAVSARRLAAAGVGPAVGNLVLVRALEYPGTDLPSVSAGFVVGDLTGYVRRRPTGEADLAVAGVTPDRIQSALRQQIRGYVSDHDSVVGVYPIDAEDAVCRFEAMLDDALARGGGGSSRLSAAAILGDSSGNGEAGARGSSPSATA